MPDDVIEQEVEQEAWKGEERRSPTALDDRFLDALLKTNEQIGEHAKSNVYLADALSVSVLRQGRTVRIWLALLSVVVAGLMLFEVTTRVAINDAARVAESNNRIAAEVEDCVTPDGACTKRQAATADAYITILIDKFQKANDDNRKLLAEELICYTENRCPVGMDRNNLPDLSNVPPK